MGQRQDQPALFRVSRHNGGTPASPREDVRAALQREAAAANFLVVAGQAPVLEYRPDGLPEKQRSVGRRVILALAQQRTGGQDQNEEDSGRNFHGGSQESAR